MEQSSIKAIFGTKLLFANNPNNLDPSYKMDLDFWDCFGREKSISYSKKIPHHRRRKRGGGARPPQ